MRTSCGFVQGRDPSRTSRRTAGPLLQTPTDAALNSISKRWNFGAKASPTEIDDTASRSVTPRMTSNQCLASFVYILYKTCCHKDTSASRWKQLNVTVVPRIQILRG